MPKVSIIMGVYNGSKVIEEAINSMINQTFSNFEFIICDDKSTDETLQIVKKIAIEDNRIIILTNDSNIGLAATLNKCLSMASGEYIARMDADDFSLPNRLEEEVLFLDDNTSYDFVGCNSKLFDDNGIFGERINIEKPNKKDFLFGTCFMHPTIMIRKKVYDELDGYRISKETERGQDYDFFMRAYALGYKGYNIQKFLYCYGEDKNMNKKRTYKNRINEAIVRYKGFKALKLMPLGYLYVIKPIVVGIIPKNLLRKLR